MVAANRELFVEQGATFTFTFRWLRETGDEQPAPVDITGYKARMQFREKQGSPVLIEATTENGYIQILEPLEGRVRVYLPASETDKLTKSTCRYDLEMVDPPGDVYRVLKGAVKIDPNITQGEEDDIPPGGP